jgi:hypothetical protein
MNTDNISTMKERVIELSYYITKAVADKQPVKVAALREEMNDVLNIIQKEMASNGKERK